MNASVTRFPFTALSNCVPGVIFIVFRVLRAIGCLLTSVILAPALVTSSAGFDSVSLMDGPSCRFAVASVAVSSVSAVITQNGFWLWRGRSVFVCGASGFVAPIFLVCVCGGWMWSAVFCVASVSCG